MNTTSLIAALPKTDLHLHLVGSASVETVSVLAARHPERGVPSSIPRLREFYTFTDFAHFIDIYAAVNDLVTTPQDVTDLVVGAARDAARSGARWIELTVTAASHLKTGMDAASIAEALAVGRATARRDHAVDIGWIFDVPAEFGLEAADVTLDFLEHHAPEGTVAIGVAGMEAGAPRALFTHHVRRARALGYPAVIHAGESTGPETVWSALRDLHAIRIGHGTSAVDDAELVKHLVEHRIPLEVCVTSNVCTNSVASFEDHPVRQLIEAGVRVVIATDDPGMFATDLNTEYQRVAEIAKLSPEQIVSLARSGVDVSLAPPEVKAAMRSEVSRVASQWSAQASGSR